MATCFEIVRDDQVCHLRLSRPDELTAGNEMLESSGAMLSRVVEVAETIAEKSPLAVRETKELLNHSIETAWNARRCGRPGCARAPTRLSRGGPSAPNAPRSTTLCCLSRHQPE